MIPWITLELRGAVHVTSRHVTSRIASTLAIVWTSWYKLPNLKHFLEIAVFWELCYKASPIQTVISASYFLEQNGTMQKVAFIEIPKHSIQNRALEKSVTPCSTVRHRLLKTKVILQVYRKEPIYIFLLRPNVINVCSLGRWYLKPLCSFMNGYYYNMVSCSGEFRTTYCHSVCFIWWVSEWLTDWLFCILESP